MSRDSLFLLKFKFALLFMIGGDWDDGVVVIKLLSKGFGVDTFDDDVAGDIC